MIADLETLMSNIHQISHVEAVIDIPPTDGSNDVSLHFAFENEKDLDIHQKHPKLVKGSLLIDKLHKGGIAFNRNID